jgi:nucleoside-diphosphate-sugar epimerase
VEPGNFWTTEKNFLWASKSFELISNTVQSSSAFVVSLGSCAEYEWPTIGSISESTPLNPRTKYGEAKKRLFEELKNSNLEFLWPRVFFMYDGFDQGGKFLNYLHNSYTNKIQPWIENPEMKVDYVNVHDVAEAICTLISLKCLGVFNIGTGVGISNLELAQLMKAAIGAKQSPIFDPGRKNEVSVVAETSKLNELVPVGKFRSIRSELNSFYKIG